MNDKKLNIPGPHKLIKYFRHQYESSHDEHYKNGMSLCEKWISLLKNPDVHQGDISDFIAILNEEKNYGSGWIDLKLQFKAWARHNGFTTG